MPIKKETAIVRLRELYRQAHHGLEAENIEQLLRWTDKNVFNLWASASIRYRGVSFVYCLDLWNKVQENRKQYDNGMAAMAAIVDTTDDVLSDNYIVYSKAESEPLPIADQIISDESK